MIWNYFVTLFRHQGRNKNYAVINIGGLSIGLAAAIMILLFVRDELNYDRFWPDSERIHRLEIGLNISGRPPITLGTSMAGIKPLLESNATGIESIARIRVMDELTIRIDQDQYIGEAAFADPALLDIFEFEFVEGSAASVLQNPGNMIMTESAATKYFGDDLAMGHTVTLNPGSDRSYTIAAIIRDLPGNTNLEYLDIIVPMDVDYISSVLSTNPTNIETLWTYFSVLTYLKLEPGADPNSVINSFLDVFDTHVPARLTRGGELRGSDVLTPVLTPIKDLHLYGGQTDAAKPPGDTGVIYGLALIAGLLLVTAAVNFINLATAVATRRGKEVGLRKVFGAHRANIIVENLGETLVAMGLALGAALILVNLLMPWFNIFLARVIEANFYDPVSVFALFLIVVFMTLASGLYPALFLSSFTPLKALKSNTSADGSTSKVRVSLVMLQFTIAIALMIATTIVIQQTRYSTEMPLGFNKDNMLVVRKVRSPNVSEVAMQTMMQRLRQSPVVDVVTRSQYVPGDDSMVARSIEYTRNGGREEALVDSMQLDYGFFETYEIPLIAGRTFSRDIQTDALQYGAGDEPAETAAVIINETAAKTLGYASPTEALGEFIHFVSEGSDMEIIGVIPDINLRSTRIEVRPFVYYVDDSNLGTLSIKTEPGQSERVLADLHAVWNDLVPASALQFGFLDENISALYREDKQQSILLSSFAVLAIFLSCLGLYGLTSFSAERRTKEIGVRKVLGASFSEIIRLVVWQFSKSVLIANLVAWPVAFFFMNQWLEGFAFRIDMHMVYFIGPSLLAVLIAWATVAGHAIRVARTNPVHALRHE